MPMPRFQRHARAPASLVLAAILAATGCGRVSYDQVPTADAGGDEPLLLTSDVEEVNVNAHAMFTASGGAGGYSYSIVSGEGSIEPDTGDFVAPHYAGTTVVRVTDASDQTADASIVAGGSTLYVLGGWGGYTTDAVYHSPDAGKWAVDYLDQSRGETVTVVFQNQMFITGGWYGGNNISSVLTSATGYTGSWSQAGDFPAPRGWGGGVVYNGRIIYAGGRGADWANSDVYSSPDGATWTKIGDMPEASTWGGLAVFHETLWYLGGDHEPGGISDTIYSSIDGVDWTVHGATLPEPRAGGAILVFQDRLWYFGGADVTGASRDQIWYSTDGTTWVDTGATLPISVRNPASTVHDGRMWIIGGNDGSYVNTVFYSTDGLQWTRAADLPETLDRFSAVSFSPVLTAAR